MEKCEKCGKNDLEMIVFNNFKSLYCNNCKEDITFLNKSLTNNKVLTLSSSNDALIKSFQRNHLGNKTNKYCYIFFDGFEFSVESAEYGHKSQRTFLEINKILEFITKKEFKKVIINDFSKFKQFNNSILQEFRDNISLLDIFKMKSQIIFNTHYKNLQYIDQLNFFLEYFNEINLGSIKEATTKLEREDWLFIINSYLNLSPEEFLSVSNLNKLDFIKFKLNS